MKNDNKENMQTPTDRGAKITLQAEKRWTLLIFAFFNHQKHSMRSNAAYSDTLAAYSNTHIHLPLTLPLLFYSYYFMISFIYIFSYTLGLFFVFLLVRLLIKFVTHFSILAIVFPLLHFSFLSSVFSNFPAILVAFWTLFRLCS